MAFRSRDRSPLQDVRVPIEPCGERRSARNSSRQTLPCSPMGGRCGLGVCVLALVGLMPARAPAAPCSDLPSPVYVRIASTQEPLVKRLARSLRDNTPKPLSLVYVTSGN